ncbi:MAG: trypsin-like peptidase domain-containing protein [Planctomycetes bacterium]|nr:trypsin-like peptidase domain-containing protein [Planctomycetota bacterium]
MKRSVTGAFFCIVFLAVAAGADARLDARRSAVVRAIERAAPAVVNISTEKVTRRGFFPGQDFFFSDPFFGGFRQPMVTKSLGSGGIFTSDGYVFTNAHVVNQASRIMVTLKDGTKYPAELINVDVSGDIAVIRVKAEKPLPTLVFGRSDDLLVGERAIAVGNPFGLENSVTTGIISAVKRDIVVGGQVRFRDVIQTDTLINPGNSGGPLLNIFGEVIGISSAVRAEAQGIGFAIPVDRVKRSLAALLDYRKLRRIKLGLDIEPEYVSSGPRMLLVVKGVAQDGPAERSGVKAGDVIVAVGDRPASLLVDFMAGVLASGPGYVDLTLEREHRRLTLRLAPKVIPKPNAARLARSMLGLSIQQMESSLARDVGIDIDHGILVAGVEPNSTAWASKIRAGLVILQVNDTLTPTTDDFAAALEAAQGARSLHLVVARAEGRMIMQYIVEVGIRRQ